MIRHICVLGLQGGVGNWKLPFPLSPMSQLHAVHLLPTRVMIINCTSPVVPKTSMTHAHRQSLAYLHSLSVPSFSSTTMLVVNSCMLLQCLCLCSGLAAGYLIMLWTTTILRQQQPNISVFYDHSPSPYQCSVNKSIAAIMQPANHIIRTTTPPQHCARWPFGRQMHYVEDILMGAMGGLITETLHHKPVSITGSQLNLQRQLLLDAAHQALCPAVNDWWGLTPRAQIRVEALKRQLQSRQRPVIAVHARGGDKAAELGEYVDPETGQYPMMEGLLRLSASHPGIHRSSPTCLIIGDDHKYAQSVRTMVQDTLNCGEVVMRVPREINASHDQRSFNAQPLAMRCLATEEYLIDIELMAWSNFLIANHRACADTIATFLRTCTFHHDFSSVLPGTGSPRFTLWAR